ncbi:Retrovirus-related Pol polyprotein from transposon 17.6 [Labeo rohita]|uniref:Retrovirus-related Pol polyprotein from transposon 17.6 n=1 Tax=Labeo rohita TaxID=84645 RepID=A0ABQ8L2N1_LABRO|nr:Retrovirus-related Pol polyprotein from transposon 17.6 [Labeo rohita]
MAAASNVIPFGLLFMRPLQWCLKTKGVLPEGKPALHDQGHAAMPTCLGHVEKTLVLVSGPGAGSSLSPRMLATDASLIGWGVVMSDPPARGLWSSHHPVLRELVTPVGVSTAANYLAAWKLLPNVSAWVLRTVERGYRNQFGAPPPPFYGISTVVSPEQGLVMEQEVETLLRKEATEVVPPHVRESGFYSRYFIVPRKDGALHSPPAFEGAGVETERQEECAVSIIENHLSRRGVGFDMWKKPWFLSQGPVLEAPCRRVTLATDASLTGWGAVMSGHPARGLWSSRHLTWHISCLEMLAVFRALKHFLPDLIGHHVLVRTDNTAVDKLLSLRAVHVPGHLNMGADILSRQGLRPGEWMLHPPWGLDAMVQMWPRLRLYAFPLITLLPGAGVLEFVGVAPEGAHLIAPGLSTEVVETILQSRAPSSRKLYALKWKPFTSWCGDRQQDSVNCPVGTVLRFLQVRFSTGLAHSTLKVYVAAILAYHAPLGGSSVGWNPLVTRFLRGALRPRPLARCSLLSVVGMLFHSFESSDLPFLGVKALFS